MTDDGRQLTTKCDWEPAVCCRRSVVNEYLVECHSGYTYAERPVGLHWQGELLEVAAIESQWHSPDGKYFRVRTRDDQVFELIYSEAHAEWQVREA